MPSVMIVNPTRKETRTKKNEKLFYFEDHCAVSFPLFTRNSSTTLLTVSIKSKIEIWYIPRKERKEELDIWNFDIRNVKYYTASITIANEDDI